MLNLFTPDMGKISLAVRGGRKIGGKRGRPLRFARLEFTSYIRDGAESGYLSDVDPAEVFLFEKEGQLGRLTFASAALELLNALLTAHDPQPICYQLTLSFLRMTDSIEKKRLPGLFGGYILRLVSLLGFRPNLVGCAGCGRDVSATLPESGSPSIRLFSLERGGMICENCRRTETGETALIGLPADVHQKMLHLLQSSLEEASRLTVSLVELTVMVDLLTGLLRFHAGTVRHLKSFDFLDKLIRAVETNGG